MYSKKQEPCQESTTCKILDKASSGCYEVTNNINCPSPDVTEVDTTDSTELDVAQESCPVLEPGDLYKFPTQTSVFTINKFGERMYFPHQNVHLSWYQDFSGIIKIHWTCFDNYPSPDEAPFGINFRPGAYLVKVVGMTNVFAVLPGNTLAKITNEDVAAQLYGENWKYEVKDVYDFFWPNYVNQAPDITEAVPHDGMLVKLDGNEMVWHVESSALVHVIGVLGLLVDAVHTVSPEVLSVLPFSTTTTTMAEILADPSQLGMD
ncbi:MAG: hypothetical protein ABII02_04760 [Candidatus Magasanikbacteria bacterium]